MQSKTLFFPVLMALLSLLISARAESKEEAEDYTLQVASFPDRAAADDFINQVAQAGEQPFWGTVELPGRGQWIRVFIGSFATIAAARRYGESLIERGTIKEFLVRKARETRFLGRPRRVIPARSGSRYESKPVIAGARLTRRKALERSATPSTYKVGLRALERGGSRGASTEEASIDASAQGLPFCCLPPPGGPFHLFEIAPAENLEHGKAEESAAAATTLPEARDILVSLAPPVDPALIPRPDPVRLALKMAANQVDAGAGSRKGGGLQLSGDINEALDRLRWIAGAENASAILAGSDGRALICAETLARASGINGLPPASATLVLADYINSNDGLLLLVQLIYGQYNYILHIGERAPTAGQQIEITGSLNLDNNFDTRINPYRRFGRKLDRELPPEGFDAMVALNPVARWFNLHAKQMVPIGNITFHELAESHAKVALGLNYLGQASRPGAHNVAIERERRLQSQRPFTEIVLTAGTNRVLRSPEEIRRFTSAPAPVSGHR